MVGSGRWNDRAQLHARTALNEMVRIAFQETSIAWRKLAVEDGGDGMIVLVPATMSKVDLIGSVVPRLTAALREHNAMGDLVPRIRLRVAIHAGEVLRGPFSWVGADLIMTCRLVNGQPLYRQLKRHPHADLVLVVSDVIHRAVVRQGHRDIDPAGYTSVVIAVKEMRTRAWLHTPSSKTGRPGRRRSVRAYPPRVAHGYLLPWSLKTLRLSGGTAEKNRRTVLNIVRPIRLSEMNCSALRREPRTALKP